MKKYFKFLIILLIPFIFGFVFSRYSPWWGLREQGSIPDTPSDGIKLYADSNNNLFVLQESGSSTQLNSPTDLGNPATAGTLSLGSGSITDSSGAISFGDENVTSTGDITGKDFYITSTLYRTGDTNTAIVFDDDRIKFYAGARLLLDLFEGAQEYVYLGYEAGIDVDVVIGSGQAIVVSGETSRATFLEAPRTATPKWYYCKYMDAISVSAGGSGATLTVPSANTLGGYLLDNAAEYLYFNGKACSNIDPNSDVTVTVTFEVNVDNSGGSAGDTVDISLLSYFKGSGETANKTQTIETATTVGTSPQYKQFSADFVIDEDDGSNPIDSEDIFAMRINLETDTSEVDNIIVNFICFHYQTAKVHAEI